MFFPKCPLHKMLLPPIYLISVYVLFVYLCFMHKKRKNCFIYQKPVFPLRSNVPPLRVGALDLVPAQAPGPSRYSAIAFKYLVLKFHTFM